MDNEGNNETERQLQEDLKKTKIRRFWGFAHICRVLGHFGNGRHFSGLEFEDPLITLLDTLRSGQNISTENAVALADLIDNKSGLNIYQMRLVKVRPPSENLKKKCKQLTQLAKWKRYCFRQKM